MCVLTWYVLEMNCQWCAAAAAADTAAAATAAAVIAAAADAAADAAVTAAADAAADTAADDAFANMELQDVIAVYGKGSRAIVFTQTKKECDELAAGNAFKTLSSQVRRVCKLFSHGMHRHFAMSSLE